MAKDKENEIVESNAPALIETEDGSEINTADLLKQIEEASVGLQLGSDYFKIEPGETARVVFIEMTEMQGMGDKSGELVESVKLLGPDGRIKINGDKVIVSTCRSLSLKGRKNVPLQIINKGMVKSKNGFKYADFQINELIMK